MFLATNHAPNLASVDDAIRDRLRLIPFDHHVAPAGRIPDLAEQLVDAEGSGILNWLLEGLWKVHAEGLGYPPRAVRELTDDYFDTADDLVHSAPEDGTHATHPLSLPGRPPRPGFTLQSGRLTTSLHLVGRGSRPIGGPGRGAGPAALVDPSALSCS